MPESEYEILVKDEMLERVFDQKFEGEQTFFSGQTLILDTYISGNLAGTLKSVFKIRREVDTEHNKFVEKDRYVRIGDIGVVTTYRKKGVATGLLNKLEGIAIKFGASWIEGILSVDDLSNQPWLTKFYEKNGYKVGKKDGVTLITKPLI